MSNYLDAATFYVDAPSSLFLKLRLFFCSMLLHPFCLLDPWYELHLMMFRAAVLYRLLLPLLQLYLRCLQCPLLLM